MSKVIEINNLSKVYDLGLVGTGTLSKDLNRTWAKLRGKPDPYATLVELNDRTKKSSSNMVYALKDINFSVEQGEVLGIIGKNGAGKSTLLKVLSQITSPSTGTIKMKGRVASLLEVGTGMHPEMTARQNIYLNGSLMGMSRNEITSKLNEIIEFAGIEKYVDTPIKRFSSGMKVRLGFAIAAFLEPEILIVDEVLAVGDAEFQKKAIGKMQEVSQQSARTVIFVSHNMNSINNLCSSCIYMKNGEIISSGLPADIINQYLTYETSTSTNRNWKINLPGDKFITLRSIKITNTELSQLFIHQSINFELIYNIKLPSTSSPIPNIHLFTLQGDYVLTSSSATIDSPNEKGTYKAVFTIPGNLLNTGTYSIGIACSTMKPHTIVHFYEKEALIFELIEDIKLRHIDYRNEIPGIIRPEIKWKINKTQK